MLRITSLGRILGFTVFLITLLLLSTVSFGAETPDKQPSHTDDPLPQSSWYQALTEVKSVPANIWERMKLAEQWVWEEYPDQVLIQQENRIKWPRYLSAAFNTPEWLDVAFANRFRREGFDSPFTTDQEGTTWDWAQRDSLSNHRKVETVSRGIRTSRCQFR